VVAVHGVFDEVAGDEEVTVEVRDSDIGNDETVAILVEDEAALDFVAGKGFVLRETVGGGLGRGARLRGGLLRAGSLSKKEAPVGKFFDEAALFELGKHLEEGAAAGLPDLKRAREVFEGDWAVFKL